MDDKNAVWRKSTNKGEWNIEKGKTRGGKMMTKYVP